MHAQHDSLAVALPRATGTATHMAMPALPSPRTLEDRRLIHRNDSVRAQADAFRDLRTQLLALSDQRNFVTLVVPVTAGCGGSFVARNLALAFAFDESKMAVLLDCDVLYPSQRTAFGVDAAHCGLVDYLEDEGRQLSEIQYDTGIPRLRVVPSGTRRESTGEHFSSVRARTMIDSLRSTSPGVYPILDSPPALTSPDARILADLSDFVVLVAGYGRTTQEQIDKAMANFSAEKVAGIVFNNRV